MYTLFSMSWSPESLPENVKLILSTSESSTSISEKFGWTSDPSSTPPMSPTPPHIGADNLVHVVSRPQDVIAWFALGLLDYSCRRMTDGQLDSLHQLCPESPLVASLTFGDLTTTGCRPRHRVLADAVKSLVNRARERHGTALVDAVLCLIDASAAGLSDAEMVDVLSRDFATSKITTTKSQQFTGDNFTASNTPVNRNSRPSSSCTTYTNGLPSSTPSSATTASNTRFTAIATPRFSPFTWLYIRRCLSPLFTRTADGRTCWRCSAIARQWRPATVCSRAKSTSIAWTPSAAQREYAHCTLADYFAGAVNSSSSTTSSRPQSSESIRSRSIRCPTPPKTLPPVLPPIGAPEIPSHVRPLTPTSTDIKTSIARPPTPNSATVRPPKRTPPNSALIRVDHSTKRSGMPPTPASDAASELVYKPAQPVLINSEPLIYNCRKLNELPLHLMASRRFSQLERCVLFDYDWIRARIYSKSTVHEGPFY